MCVGVCVQECLKGQLQKKVKKKKTVYTHTFMCRMRRLLLCFGGGLNVCTHNTHTDTRLPDFARYNYGFPGPLPSVWDESTAGVDWEKIEAHLLDYKKSCKQSHTVVCVPREHRSWLAEYPGWEERGGRPPNNHYHQHTGWLYPAFCPGSLCCGPNPAANYWTSWTRDPERECVCVCVALGWIVSLS